MAYANDFRQLVFQTAEKLTPSDRDSLHYIYELPEKDRESSNLDILKALQQKGCYSNANELAMVLKSVHREDLAKGVDSYKPSLIFCGRDDEKRAHNKSPTQLRGKCDADIAQANSIATELKNVRDSIPSKGISQDALDRLRYELVEVEKALQLVLGRCEIMHRCCIRADQHAQPLSDLPQPQNSSHQQQQGKRRPVSQARPIHLPRLNRGNSVDSATLTKRSPLPPTASFKAMSAPTYSAPSFPITVLCTPEYDLPNQPVHAVNVSGFVQCFASQDLVGNKRYLQIDHTMPGLSCNPPDQQSSCSTSSPNLTDVWKQYKVFKHYLKTTSTSEVVISSASDAEVVAEKSRKAERPQVPKKPEWFQKKESRNVNILEDSSSGRQSHVYGDTKPVSSRLDMEDSGYYTGPGSMGNLLSEWTSYPPLSSKEWFDKPRSKQKDRLYTSLKK